ncbi:MAG: SemiSWEET transporter, partial [Paludibacter sp.]|nr:SemiSWEET transporter [Paludibacter sp.]
MNFDVSIIGYAAGICSAVAQFPQAIKVYRTGDTRSISLSMYSIMTLGVAFWFAYGLALNMLPMILANGICLIPSLYVL